MQPLPSSFQNSSNSLHSLPLRWSVDDAYNDEPALLSIIKGHNSDLTPSATTFTTTTPPSSLSLTPTAAAVVPRGNIDDTEVTKTTPNKRKFDLIIACDILFFKNYHTDLIATLRRLIDPVGGKVLLLQPRRGACIRLHFLSYTLRVIVNRGCI